MNSLASTQLRRLHTLRVDRAHAALARAAGAVVVAERNVAQRLQAIAESRQRMQVLLQAWAGPNGAEWPRWASVVQAHRDAIEERIERDDYELLYERQALNEAHEECARCRAEWQRASARREAALLLFERERQRQQAEAERRAESDAPSARLPQAGVCP